MKPLRAILAIDPGRSTGIAMAVWMRDKEDYDYTSYTEQQHQHVWLHIVPPVELAIIEQFAASAIDPHGLFTVELIGGVKAVCFLKDIKLEVHTPLQRKPYMACARRLVSTGFGHTQHEVDAMSHLVRYLYKQGHITDLVKYHD